MTKEDIKKALEACADITSCENCPYDNVRNCSDTLKNDARELIIAQESEIERLKAENNELNKKNWSLEEELKKKELEITYARNNGYEKGYDECEEYMKDKIKQAQINILLELKERIETAIDTYYNSDEEGEGYFIAEDAIEDIDELIKEVQNENQH